MFTPTAPPSARKGSSNTLSAPASVFSMNTPAAAINVAVIDDDESLCCSLARLLRAAGMQPVAYTSAESYLGDTTHPPFQCLVLDIQLQGISGIDLQKYLLSKGSLVPVIFISAQDDPKAREEAFAMGCAAFFRKTEPGYIVLDAIRRAAAAYKP